jgi:hypothetical protein
MTEIIITLLIVLLSFIVYMVWIKPIRQMNLYTKLIRERGYRVLRVPYNPFKVYLQSMIKKGL